MKLPFPDKITMESIFVWLMHRIADEFEDHAILKGGISLMLLDCPRATNDIDYTFVPYSSKKDIVKKIEGILDEIPNAKITRSMNSRALRVAISVGDVTVQVEANVSLQCKSIAMTTSSLARKVGQLGRIIRIMSPDVALSHKLAAWNERRLLRDFYDIYFLYQIVGAKPEIETLLGRLKKIESRIPRFKKIKQMSFTEFISEFKQEIAALNIDSIEKELSPLLSREEIVGLEIKLKSSLNSLAWHLETLLSSV